MLASVRPPKYFRNHMRKRGWTLAELLALIAMVLVLAALLLPAVSCASRSDQFNKCASNLHELWELQWTYTIKFGGENMIMPTETCGAFWLRLQTTSPPLADAAKNDLFACPLEGNSNSAGTTDYRGPNGNVNSAVYLGGDPVGADIPGNHGKNQGGNILRKSGDIVNVPHGDALWILAGTKTCR